MSQYPTVSAGQRITASLLQSFAPIRVAKAADQNVTSSTTLVNDNDLVIPVVSGGVYDLDGFLMWTGNDTGDIKFAFNAPTGSTLDWAIFGPNEADTGFATGGTRGGSQWWVKQAQTTFPTGTIQYSASTALLIGHFMGRLVAGGAGNLTLQWAQNVSNVTTTTLKIGSWIHAQRVG